MGQCCSEPAANDLGRKYSARARNWEATGLVSLRDAKLKELPAAIEGIAPSVRALDASHNSITQLPGYLGRLVALRRLDLRSNMLAQLPASVSCLCSLRVLLVDGNALEALPDELGALPGLERLSAADNRLRRLPNSLAQLRRLRQLDVSGNLLEDLPASLGQCSSLEELAAARNRLAALPAALGTLRSLKELRLDGNAIPRVPPEVLRGCVALQTLSLHANPITPEVLAGTAGYAEYEARRTQKYSKAIAGGALLPASGLDEGVDRRTTSEG